MVELGGNIELIGFEREPYEMVVLKKVIGNYARKFSDFFADDYERLVLDLKQIHGEKSNKFQINARLLTKKKQYNSEVTENNLFVCVADVLKKIEAQIQK
ncbi:MAG: hypothetical protein QXM96_00705 [Candidatus Woesearchaeota archaeon]